MTETVQTEAEYIKKRWQEYPEELYKKDLYDSGNHNGVITHLEPDILEGGSHPDQREMVPHCGIDLHFSDNE